MRSCRGGGVRRVSDCTSHPTGRPPAKDDCRAQKTSAATRLAGHGIFGCSRCQAAWDELQRIEAESREWYAHVGGGARQACSRIREAMQGATQR